MWWLIQALIVFAIVGSNIHWQWTPNHYLPAIIGFVLALCVTGVSNELRDWARQKRSSQGRQ
jgi:hypothetical protein